ncbi:MAG TPA: AI-2E family transporter [Salinimicrobium sp.]|nr:AI-2E family transporter [Salinimicrobium sp.]
MMMTKGQRILFFSTISIVGIFFLLWGLFKSQVFLIPFTTAIILALLMIPFSNFLENKFMNRASASLSSTLVLFLISLGFMALVSFQVKNFMDDWDQIKQTMKPKVEQLKELVMEHTPVQEEQLDLSKTDQNIPFTGKNTNPEQKAGNFFGATMSFLGDYLLTFIYIFFLLNYRHRFKEFFLRLFSVDKKQEVTDVINKSARVAQKYLIGKLLLIAILAGLYAIGLGISGVNNFIIISALAALFSLIPYLGNIIGFGMAMAFGFLTTGETGVLVGIIITFVIAQFVESYILEPYVVGDQVDLHPFFVILAVVIGNQVWGIMGMILAIPILAIVNVVFRHVQVLHPFGYLLSKKDLN